MLNQEIARIFYEMADIYSLKKEKWKPQAYIVAGQTIESLKKDLEDIYVEKGITGLKELSGIGEGIAKKIKEYIETGKIKEYEKLKENIPKPILDMMNIPGIGASKAKMFYDSGIKSIEELEKKAKTHKLIGLPLIKEKSEEKILEGIQLMKSKRRISYNNAKKIADKIINKLKRLKEVEKIEIAGSLRRKMPTIGDIDIVIQAKEKNCLKIAEKFVKMPFIKRIINKGKEKVTVLTKDNFQIDIRFFNENEYGAGLLYFTGNKQHNIWLRIIAIKKGYKLNEYGLFKGNKRVAGKTEKEIYDKLGVKMLSPEKRVGEPLEKTKMSIIESV